MKSAHPKPQLYAYYFAEMQGIARDHGYNLVLHGSINRDCDLIAIPWVDDPKPEIEMIQALNKKLTGFTAAEGHEKTIYLSQRLPGGRTSYVINLNRGGFKDGEDENGNPKYVPDPEYYIDISVTPKG